MDGQGRAAELTEQPKQASIWPVYSIHTERVNAQCGWHSLHGRYNNRIMRHVMDIMYAEEAKTVAAAAALQGYRLAIR